MIISNLNISSDKSQLELTITDAQDLNTLSLWTDETYKDFSKAIDLSSKLTGSTTENITITLSDIGESYFDGVYFIEAIDNDEISLEYTYTLDKYKECILNQIIDLNSCDECLKEENLDLINAHAILKSLQYSLDLRYIEKILKFIKVLDKFCSNKCQSCKSVELTGSSNFNNNFDEITVNVTVDGGIR